MRVRVIQCFACGSRVYKPGEYDLTPELADDADELVRLGWIVLVQEPDTPPPHLSRPEDALQLTSR